MLFPGGWGGAGDGHDGRSCYYVFIHLMHKGVMPSVRVNGTLFKFFGVSLIAATIQFQFSLLVQRFVWAFYIQYVQH
jgi:hypothetical protein